MPAMAKRLLTLGAVVFAHHAWALPCAGFDDVDPSSPFCSAAEWMKNRGVTTGCTATGYCPDPAVTRAEMALFMSRLERMFPPSLADANGNVIGILGRDLAYRTPVLHYRKDGEFFAIALAYSSTLREYRLVPGHVHFEGAGCSGQAYLETMPGSPPWGGKRNALVAHWGDERLLFATARFPVIPALHAYASSLDATGCKEGAGSVASRPVNLIEDLALKFAEPFVLR